MAIKKGYLVISAFVIVAVIIATILISTLSVEKTEKYYEVKRGKFEAVLTCKGEINGLKSTAIKPPRILGDRELRLYGLKIINLALDGSNVKKGDFILQLDASTIMNGMREARQQLEKETADLNNAKIDSAVTLTQLREEIKNALLDLEYNKIDLEQSVYESKAYQRKVRMTYEKAENLIEKNKRDYQLEKNKLKVKVKRSEEKVEKLNEKIAKYQQAMKAARITAPDDGIVIFGKSWDGTKYTKDMNISTWMGSPPIATLPDMSEVISEVYVKEIDISKIETGDSVRVTFDALENITIDGWIKSIARIGEDHDDFDMKVFKVIIQLDETHEGLKPAMSSNNEIILANYDNALFIPLNAVYKENGTDYVYVKNPDGPVKRKIKTEIENEEFIVVKEGIIEGEILLLKPPASESVNSL